MACRLVALDKRPGVCPAGIGETFHRSLAKLVMRADGDQEKIACGNLQICAGLKAGIKGATYAVEQRRLESVRGIRLQEEEAEEGEEGEEESVGVARLLTNLNTETAVMEEEAAEGLADTLGM